MKKIPVFPLLMTLAAIGCFCLVYAVMLTEMLFPPYVRGIFLFLPAVILGWITWQTHRGRIQASVADDITLCLSAFFIITGFIYSMYLFSLDLSGTEDIRHYERIYEKMKDRPGVVNFPAILPDSQTEIDFHYSPQALQGHEVFTVTFTPDAEILDDYWQKFERVCIWSGTEAEYLFSYRWASGYGKEENDLYLFVWNGNTNHGERCFARIEPCGTLTFEYTRG